VLSRGFGPVADRSARVLVLGSLPGTVSLQRRQYYALPQNAFWRVMARLFGFEADAPYAARLRALRRNHVALWDVCAVARRRGALDSAIETDTVRVNGFADFLASHRRITTVFFNGARSAALYRRLVLPTLPPRLPPLRYVLLPSTSPAHATRGFEEKLQAWSSVRRAARIKKGRR
jgi:double-stranded uracil-DNA glycosylase